MKKNNKGFTLIELLAVIVILAIIALIAVPIVLNMISNARRSAARSSALGYIDSINSFIPLAESKSDLGIDDTAYADVVVPADTVTCGKTTTTSDNTTTVTWTGTGCEAFFAKVDAKTKGKKPTAATIKIGSDKQVDMSTVSLTFDGHTCSMANGSNGEFGCN